jgi:hypothetical protein
MTGGVRVKQVGVNPLDERSFRRGVANASRAKRPLACGNSTGSDSSWAAATRSRDGLPSQVRRGLDDSLVCSWVYQLQKSVGGMWLKGSGE